MNRLISIALAVALVGAAPTYAQVPPLQPALAMPYAGQQEIPALQSDLIVRAGSDRVFFGTDNYVLGAPARATLAAQARWLIANPSVRVILEGHADERDTREHALAAGERRAAAVRDYLFSQGIARHRMIVTSWGKERPNIGAPAVAARVVLVVIR
jgi:peptidoglycan-associated lipoprotein